jgi:uncharacterized protein (DUF1697 family)
MHKYVAFLRGINIGGRIIKMADLKTCFEEAGYKNVFTLLQTGNVLFESSKSARQLKEEIEETLTKTFNYPAKVQVVTVHDLQGIVNSYPFGLGGASQHDYVIFMENGLEKVILQEGCALAPNEKAEAGSGVVYWQVDKGSTLKSPFAKLLNKAKYKQFNTNRNIKTLQKIIKMAG